MVTNIGTKNFTIRPFQEKDLRAFAVYRANEKVAKYQSWTKDYTLADALALFERIDYGNFGKEGNWYQLAIIDTLSQALVGDLAVHFMDCDQVEIGFTVDPVHQGKGVGCEAVCALLDYLFFELGKHRVIAITDTRNMASCRLLEKVKFRREAHFIQNVFFKGAWGDEYVYAKLKSEQNKNI